MTVKEVRQECIDGLAALAAHEKALYYANLCEPVIPTAFHASDGCEIPLRVFRPSRQWCFTPTAPVIVFFHGGGFVIGGPVEGFDYFCQRLAVMTRCVVVSVDYRLAPEHPHPQGLNDCWEATIYIAENAVLWGGDSSKLCVCGDSAGGNLAAVVSLMARDAAPESGAAAPMVSLQVLLFPCLDWTEWDEKQSFVEIGAATPACHANHMEWYRRLVVPRRVRAVDYHHITTMVIMTFTTAVPTFLEIASEHSQLDCKCSADQLV